MTAPLQAQLSHRPQPAVQPVRMVVSALQTPQLGQHTAPAPIQATQAPIAACILKVYPLILIKRLGNMLCLDFLQMLIDGLEATETIPTAGAIVSSTAICDQPCQNGGVCVANSTSGTASCSCSNTGYSGPYCTLSSQGTFLLDDAVQYLTYPVTSLAMKTSTDHLKFRGA